MIQILITLIAFCLGWSIRANIDLILLWWYDESEKYWLKEKQFKWFYISWGRDTQSPYYFMSLPNGFDWTVKGFRVIFEWTAHLKNKA